MASCFQHINECLYVVKSQLRSHWANRRGTQMKVLYWDRSGFCVWAKRLEQGRFVSDWSKVTTRTMDWTGLKLLLEGIEPGRMKRRFRLPERSL